MKININLKPLYHKLDQAFNKTVKEYVELQKEQIEAVKWQWDKVTVRTNGEIVSSPRNIVDTGTLLNSCTIIDESSKEKIILWQVDYAEEVHEDRPWVYAFLAENDTTEIFVNNCDIM